MCVFVSVRMCVRALVYVCGGVPTLASTQQDKTNCKPVTMETAGNDVLNEILNIADGFSGSSQSHG